MLIFCLNQNIIQDLLEAGKDVVSSAFNGKDQETVAEVVAGLISKDLMDWYIFRHDWLNFKVFSSNLSFDSNSMFDSINYFANNRSTVVESLKPSFADWEGTKEDCPNAPKFYNYLFEKNINHGQ